MNYVAIDFETANEKRDSACAVGVSYVENGVITESENFLIRPKELRFNQINTKIHGISSVDVSSSPNLAEVWQKILNKAGTRPFVAHNASFDMSVLRHSLHSLGCEISPIEYACSLQLAKNAWPNLVCFSLPFLANNFDIPLEHHEPESDSRACAELILLAAQQLEALNLNQLLDRLDITSGEIQTNDKWIPSYTPRLKQNQVQFELDLPENYDIANHPLHEKRVVFTGGLNIFSRSIATQAVRSLGGHSVSSVSRKTDFLVSGIQDISRLADGKSNSSKFEKALELKKNGTNIQIITEDEFTGLLFSPIQTNKQSEKTKNKEVNMNEEQLCVNRWVARSYEISQGWKKEAKKIFIDVCGDSNLARIRMASRLRAHFVEENLKPETIDQWSENFSETIQVKVIPPQINPSNAAYIDWVAVADEILHVCATDFSELLEENLRRESEYQSASSNYKTNTRVYLSYQEIRVAPERTISDHFDALKERIPELSLANIKQATKLLKQLSKVFKPVEPEKPHSIPRYVKIG